MAATKRKAPPAQSIEGTDVAWEKGELGRDENFVERSDLKHGDLDEKMEMQMISIRLPKSLIEDFKLIAEYHGNSYQPLMRQILKRFAVAEMKTILRAVVADEKGKGRAGGKDSVQAARKNAA
jgi:predicted DNA binding CopG/RHH family protein